MSGFSDDEVKAQLERRKAASLREERPKYRPGPHPSGEPCFHCHTPLTALASASL
jgi:hypothetical protein